MRFKAGLATVAGVGAMLLAGALVPPAALAHPCYSTTEAAMGKSLTLHTGGNWAGALPAFGDSEHECSDDLNSYLYDNSAIETSAVGEPVGPVVSAAGYAIKNLTPLGYSRRDVPLSGTGAGVNNSDLAFKDNLVIAGTYDGFRILDFTDKTNPVEVKNFTGCNVGQGDIVVYGNILVRSWDAPASASSTCDGKLVGAGFEGIHVFDISDPANPVLKKQLRFAEDYRAQAGYRGCGSHTATAVPDPARDHLYIYNGGSNGDCPGIDIFKIQISDPSNVGIIQRAYNGRGRDETGENGNSCHDNNVLMNVGGTSIGYAMCAGGNGLSVYKFDMSKPVGEAGTPESPGGVENPTLAWTKVIPGVGIGHSGSFTYDGKLLVFGHEPGGGNQAQCQASSSIVNRSLFFFDAATGEERGTMLHPRTQGSRENCTWHNFNVVPTKAGYYATVGSYQSGISVFEFTNPAAPRELAYADPAPLELNPPTTGIFTGGDWSSYWHNGTIYQSDMKRGVLSWELNLANDTSAVQANSHLKRFNTYAQSNPQTQLGSYAYDSSAPTITSPVDGGSFKVGATGTADFTCADDVGIDTCVGSVASGSALDTAKLGTKSFTVTATDTAGNITTKTVSYKVNTTEFPVTIGGGSVEPAMGLSMPSSTTFGPFTPGIAKSYEANVVAQITANFNDSTLSVYDGSAANTGRLVNGTRALATPLTIKFSSGQQATGLAGGPVGGAAAPTPLLSYAAPQTNRSATLFFQQKIAANEVLAAGTYNKTLTFSLSTNTP